MRVRKTKTEMELFVCHFSQVPDTSDSLVVLMCSGPLFPCRKLIVTMDFNKSIYDSVYDAHMLVKFMHDPLDDV